MSLYQLEIAHTEVLKMMNFDYCEWSTSDSEPSTPTRPENDNDDRKSTVALVINPEIMDTSSGDITCQNAEKHEKMKSPITNCSYAVNDKSTWKNNGSTGTNPRTYRGKRNCIERSVKNVSDIESNDIMARNLHHSYSKLSSESDKLDEGHEEDLNKHKRCERKLSKSSNSSNELTSSSDGNELHETRWLRRKSEPVNAGLSNCNSKTIPNILRRSNKSSSGLKRNTPLKNGKIGLQFPAIEDEVRNSNKGQGVKTIKEDKKSNELNSPPDPPQISGDIVDDNGHKFENMQVFNTDSNKLEAKHYKVIIDKTEANNNSSLLLQAKCTETTSIDISEVGTVLTSVCSSQSSLESTDIKSHFSLRPLNGSESLVMHKDCYPFLDDRNTNNVDCIKKGVNLLKETNYHYKNPKRSIIEKDKSDFAKDLCNIDKQCDCPMSSCATSSTFDLVFLLKAYVNNLVSKKGHDKNSKCGCSINKIQLKDAYCQVLLKNKNLALNIFKTNGNCLIKYFQWKCHHLTAKVSKYFSNRLQHNSRFWLFFPPLFINKSNASMMALYPYNSSVNNYIVHYEKILFFLFKLSKMAPTYLGLNDCSHFQNFLTLSNNSILSVKNIHLLNTLLIHLMPSLQYLFANKNVMIDFYNFMYKSLVNQNLFNNVESVSVEESIGASKMLENKPADSILCIGDIEKEVMVDAKTVKLNSDSLCISEISNYSKDYREEKAIGNILTREIKMEKEEIDTIDGIDIISFETEKDMEEYTKLQLMLLEQKQKGTMKSNDLKCKINVVPTIIPTKTNDITKIKGWRYKNFASETGNSNSVNDENRYFDKVFCNKSIDVTCYKKTPIRLLKEQLENTYAKKIAEDEILRDLEKKVNTQRDLRNSIFDSGILNEFLNKHAVLNISYEVPKLSAADCFKPDIKMFDPVINGSSISSFNVTNNTKSNNKNFGSCKPKTKAQKRFYLEMELIKEQDKLDIDKLWRESDFPVEVKKAKRLPRSRTPIKQKYDFNPNHKYMWIQGRPIRILGYKADFNKKKKFSVPILSTACVSDLRKPIALQFKQTISVENLKEETKTTESSLLLPQDNVANLKCIEDIKTEIPDPGYFENEQISRPQYKMLPEKLKEEIELNELSPILHPKSGVKNSFYVIYPCHHITNETKVKHKYCKADQFRLGLILNIGHNRPLSNDATHNLNLLKNDNNIVDSRLAHIAASALQTSICDENKKKVSRFIVPVVSDKIVMRTKYKFFNTGEDVDLMKNYDLLSFLTNIDKFNVPSKHVDIVDEVKGVVNDIVDYASRLSEIPECSYDPDAPKSEKDEFSLWKKKSKDKIGKSGVERELRRLINVSIVDVTPDTNTDDPCQDCKKDFCLKGCVCASLNGKLSQAHCGKLSCMFDCSCPNKNNSGYEYLRFQAKEKTLAKEEKSWHQTVIRKQNKVISVMVGTERVKREKKLPSRYRNNVLVGKEMFSLETRSGPHGTKSKYFGIKSKYLDPAKQIKSVAPVPVKIEPETIPVSTTEKKNTKVKKTNDKKIKPFPKTMKIESVKRTTLYKILNFNCNTMNFEKKSLADVLIWCVIHNMYNCNCSAWVCHLKNNNLFWRPTRFSKYLSHKYMSTLILPKLRNLMKVQIYNTDKFCCRTFGSVTNYALRNKSQIYHLKRVREFETSCLSYSNSIYKIRRKGKFSMDISDPKEDTDDHSEDEENIIPEEFVQNEEESDALSSSLKPRELEHLSLSLPTYSVPCKWWVIELQPIFDFLVFAEESDPLSYGMLQETIANAQWRKCVVQLPLSCLANTFGIHFGAYAVNELKNVICIGPFRLEDDHGLMLYKCLNRKMQIIPFANSIGKKDYSVGIVGFWCYLKQKSETLTPWCPEMDNQFSNDSNTTIDDFESDLLNEILSDQYQPEDTGLLPVTQDNNVSSQISPVTIKQEKCEEPIESYDSTVLNNDDIHSHKGGSTSTSTVKCPLTKEQSGSVVEEKKPDRSSEYGLLCLTSDIGYLPVTEYTAEKLTVQDPIDSDIFHTFKNLETTCTWLNRYMSRKMVFEPEDLFLDWIIVKPGILKHISAFDPAFLNKSYVVTKEGVSLINKNGTNCSEKSVPNEASLSSNVYNEKTRLKGKVGTQIKRVNSSLKPTPTKRRKLSIGDEPVLRTDAFASTSGKMNIIVERKPKPTMPSQDPQDRFPLPLFSDDIKKKDRVSFETVRTYETMAEIRKISGSKHTKVIEKNIVIQHDPGRKGNYQRVLEFETEPSNSGNAKDLEGQLSKKTKDVMKKENITLLKATPGTSGKITQLKLCPIDKINSLGTGRAQKLIVGQSKNMPHNDKETKVRLLVSGEDKPNTNSGVVVSNKFGNKYRLQSVETGEILRIGELQAVKKKGVILLNQLPKNKSLQVSIPPRALNNMQTSGCKRKENSLQGLSRDLNVTTIKKDIEQGPKRRKTTADERITTSNETQKYLDNGTSDPKLKRTTECHKIPVDKIIQTKNVASVKPVTSDGFNSIKGLPFISTNPELSITEVPKDSSSSSLTGKGVEKKNLMPKKISVIGGLEQLRSINKIGDKGLKPCMGTVLSGYTVTPKSIDSMKSIDTHKLNSSTAEQIKYVSCEKDIVPQKVQSARKCLTITTLNKRSATQSSSEASGGSQLAKLTVLKPPLRIESVNLKQAASLSTVEADSTRGDSEENLNEKLNDVRDKFSKFKYMLGPQYKVLDIVDKRGQKLNGSIVRIDSNKDKKFPLGSRNIDKDQKSDLNKVTQDVQFSNRVLGASTSKLAIVSPKVTSTKHSGDIFLEGKKLCSIPLIPADTQTSKANKTK